MRTTLLLPALLTALLAVSALPAQAPSLSSTPAVQPGGVTVLNLLGGPGDPFLVLADVQGGPLPVAWGTLYLGVSPALSVIGAGTLDGQGQWKQSLPIASTANHLVGVSFFFQGLTLTLSTPRLTGGASTVVWQGRAALRHDYADPVALGLTGDYDRAIKGRLMAGAVTRRLHRPFTVAKGTPFGQPLLSPLNPHGCRQQVVYTAKEMGATGVEEWVTAVHWRPSGTVLPDRFDRFAILAAHSAVKPDYSIGVFTQLPNFPNSGLAYTFASNYRVGTRPSSLYQGAYAIVPAALRPDGYQPYPGLTAPFRYNGRDSLLLEFKTWPSTRAQGVNGLQVQLMVTSSARPNGRAQDAGKANALVDPDRAPTATSADNAMYDLQIELTRTASSATSPWFQAPAANPRYGTPLVAASVPAGAEVRFEYRGARDGSGTGATPWNSSVGVADGLPYLQYRVFFEANPATGLRPSIDTLVIPVR